MATAKRPKHLNLLVIHLPLPGVVSILHRVSGILLIGALPLLVWALSCAVDSPEGYEQAKYALSHPVIKLGLLAIIWSSMHHLCAGIRFLFLEIMWGLDLPKARASSWAVLATSLALTTLTAYSWLL